MLPDFLCIGVYRAGTTWLQEVLSAHPDIFVPREKEIMFFSHHYSNGLSWYENFFKNEDPGILKGEICPTYFTHPLAAQRIHSAIPDARLIVILRNPVEQVHSLYKLWIRRGYTTWSLEKVVVKEPEFIANVMYSKNLRRYYNYFDKKTSWFCCLMIWFGTRRALLNPFIDSSRLKTFTLISWNSDKI